MSNYFELTKIHDFYRLLHIHQYELCIQDIAECNVRRILIMKVMNYLMKIIVHLKNYFDRSKN